MRIQHNIMAMNAYRNYTNNVSAMKKNLEKLSSGYKINRAGDDAAGLAISEKMRAQITGLQQAQANAKSGINLVQTAEGALTEVHDMLNRMIKLADQSANGTYDDTTDRTQLQKEVNQLLDEINRIADSSNFNGIKLLDGKLGLNTDAFTVGETVEGVDAVAAKLITGSKGGAAPAAKASAHVSDTADGQEPSFVIDFADLAMKVTGASDQDVTVTIGSGAGIAKTITITLTKGGADLTSVATYTASQIAAKVVTAFNTGSNGKGTAAGAINGLMFTASADGGKITFTYAGVATTGGANVEASKTLGDEVTAGTTYAAQFNKIYGGAVSISTVANKATIAAGRVNCDITKPVEAIAAGSKQRAGISFTLGSKTIADGNTITIDGKTFTIKTAGSDSVVASNAPNVINLSAYASAGSATQMRQLVLALANQTTDNFTIHTEDADAGKIHLEQTVKSFKGSGTVKGKNYDYDMLSKLVEVKDAGTPAKAAGVQLTVTASAIKDGNVISVVDGTKTTKYVFGKGTDTADVKYVASKTVAALAAAIGTDKTEVSGNTITIRAAAANVDAKAPTILGKGLTFQIGDTSDPWNQLNVAVQDMHTKSLGIDELDISTEEAAQAAIDKIKAAINTVSDVRGTLGATQNRLDHTINNLSVMTENIQDAESTIRDTDVAEEMMAYTKNNILIQSAQAMLAQANQVPQGVLQLLQ